MRIESKERIHAHNLFCESPAFSMRLTEESSAAVAVTALPELCQMLRRQLSRELGREIEPPVDMTTAGLVCWVATEFQRSLGAALDLIRQSSGPVIFACENHRLGEWAAENSVALVDAWLRTAELIAQAGGGVPESEAENLRRPIARFFRRASRFAAPAQDRAVLEAARGRGIEVLQLGQRILQLGQGRFSQMLYGSSTSRDHPVGSVLASNKAYTKRLLVDLGIPTARFERVRNAKKAVRAAGKIGYPVVVKPNRANLGRGVTTGIETPDEVRKACIVVREFGRSIIVEEFVAGDDHRLLVIGGTMVAAAHRVPARVIGDGEHSVEELVGIANRDPRRRSKHRGSWTALRIDAVALQQLADQGVNATDIPDPGRAIFLRAVANTSSGGTARDVTAAVHPENRRFAERAARALGLQVAGVDLLTPDITQPISETGGGIIEVNSKPGLRKHLWPAEGESQDVLSPLLDLLHPAREFERFVVITVLAADSAAKEGHEVVAGLNETLRRCGATPGLENHADCGALRARGAFLDPDADLAVLVTTPADLTLHGLGYRATTVAVLLGPFVLESDRAAIERVVRGSASVVLEVGSEHAGAVPSGVSIVGISTVEEVSGARAEDVSIESSEIVTLGRAEERRSWRVGGGKVRVVAFAIATLLALGKTHTEIDSAISAIRGVETRPPPL